MDWFPRLRAMSLAAIDGDGEQIELRTLQLHLESTQTLVSKLSVQLMELKDQVKNCYQTNFLCLFLCIM